MSYRYDTVNREAKSPNEKNFIFIIVVLLITIAVAIIASRQNYATCGLQAIASNFL